MIWYDAQETFLCQKETHPGSMVGQQWETDAKVHWKTPLPSLMTAPWWEAWRRFSLFVETRSDDRIRHWWPHFSQVDQEHHQTSGRPAALERDRAGRSSGNKAQRKQVKTPPLFKNTSSCFPAKYHEKQNCGRYCSLFWDNLEFNFLC